MSTIHRFVRFVVESIAERLAPPRVIYDGNGREPYLSRYYLFGRPVMPDGSEPFDTWGNPKKDATWRNAPAGLYLHRFHRSDVDRELHNHPYEWSVSFVLAGGYSEERRRTRDEELGGCVGEGMYEVVRKLVKPFRLNFIMCDTFHRVDLTERDAWTLWLVGPKTQSWGFWDRETYAYTKWRDFVEARQGQPS